MERNKNRVKQLLLIFINGLILIVVLHKVPQLFKKAKPIFSSEEIKKITKIAISSPESTFTLVIKGNKWILENETPGEVNEQTMGSLQNSLSQLTIDEEVSIAKDYKRFGLEGSRKIMLTLRDSSFLNKKNSKSRTIFVGNTHDFTQTYFRVDNDSKVYTTNDDLRVLFIKDAYHQEQVKIPEPTLTESAPTPHFDTKTTAP